MLQTTTLNINGNRYKVPNKDERTLQDALRLDLGMTGTKKVVMMDTVGHVQCWSMNWQ